MSVWGKWKCPRHLGTLSYCHHALQLSRLHIKERRSRLRNTALCSSPRGPPRMWIQPSEANVFRQQQTINISTSNCSAEAPTSLWSHLEAELFFLPSFCFSWQRTDWLLVWRHLVGIYENYKDYKMQTETLTSFPLFPPTVTMVLFLVGFSVAVNNSAHENQTAGNKMTRLFLKLNRCRH